MCINHLFVLFHISPYADQCLSYNSELSRTNCPKTSLDSHTSTSSTGTGPQSETTGGYFRLSTCANIVSYPRTRMLLRQMTLKFFKKYYFFLCGIFWVVEKTSSCHFLTTPQIFLQFLLFAPFLLSVTMKY